MKLAAFLLLVVGWGLVMAALRLLHAAMARDAFVAAGLCVELLGLGLATKAHLAKQTGRD